MSEKILLKLVEVSKAYDCQNIKVQVLRGVNLSVYEEEIVAIVGPSGSGKSTLLHIAGLIDSCDFGEVHIGSKKMLLNDPDISKVRSKNIGYVYQNHYLMQDFSILENVAMPMIIAGKNKSDSYDRGMYLLDRLGLKEKANFYPNQLSGGQVQRASVARALSNKPSIILADEPTGNLDRSNAMDMFGFFCAIAQEEKCCVVIVTHSDEIAKSCNKIYKLASNGNFEQ